MLSSQANPLTMSRPATANGACEWDRLMKEREELLKTGAYTEEDPLIKEIDRQITSSQLKSQSGNQQTNNAASINQRVTAQ